MAKYITVCKHNEGADPNLDSFDNMEDAVNEVHKFFISYDCELVDGKPYDSGNATFDGDPDGFKCFSNVEMHNGKVAGFTHCHGDGPVAYIKIKE